MWKMLIAASAATLLTIPALACEWRTMAKEAALPEEMLLAQAQGSQARPSRGPQSETSVPNAAPPATTTQTTAAPNQPVAVQQMNEAEKNKVEKTGK